MSIQAVSFDQTNKSATNSTAQSSTWNGRGVVVADQAYLAKQAVEAGVSPGMFDGLGRGLATLAVIFAGVIASVAVGIATGSLQSALITLAVVGAGAAIVNLYLYVTNRRF